MVVEEEEFARQLVEEEYIKVRFMKNQNISWGKVDAFTNEEGDTFVSLT